VEGDGSEARGEDQGGEDADRDDRQAGAGVGGDG
jgi:hypothetical protein